MLITTLTRDQVADTYLTILIFVSQIRLRGMHGTCGLLKAKYKVM